MKGGGSVDWGVFRGVDSGVGRGVGDELDIIVSDEVSVGSELEVGGKYVSTSMSKMNQIWRFLTV